MCLEAVIVDMFSRSLERGEAHKKKVKFTGLSTQGRWALLDLKCLHERDLHAVLISDRFENNASV